MKDIIIPVNKSTKIVIIVGLIWFLSLIMILAPLTTSARITVGRSYQVYSTPDQNMLLVLGHTNVLLLNLNLEKHAEFVNLYSGSYSSLAFDWFPPVWSPDQKYVILQNENYVYYLDSGDLSLKYEFNKGFHLKIDRSHPSITSSLSQSFIDDEYNLHYLNNNSLYKFNPESGIIQKTLDISYNNVTFQLAKFHPNGDYVALSEWEGDVWDLLVINLKSGEYIPIENYVNGKSFFSPSKPYIGFTTSYNSEDEDQTRLYNLTVYDLENKTYGNSFLIGSMNFEETLAWSHNSDQIMRILPNNEKGRYARANTNNVVKYDVMSGKKEFNYKFSRGYMYESDPDSYTWLSKSNKVAMLEWKSMGPNNLIIQDIDDQGLTINTISNYAIALFGLISLLLVAAIYHYRKPMLFNSITNVFWSQSEEKKLSKDIVDEFSISGLVLLIIYYFIASLLNSSVAVGGDMSNMPISIFEFLIFSFISLLDILVIGTTGLLFYANQVSKSRAKSIQMNTTTILLILTILSIRYIQGYSFGMINENFNGITNFSLVLFVILISIWVFQILKVTNTNPLMFIFHLISVVIYIFTYRETF